MLNEFRQKQNDNSRLQAIAHCNTVLSQIVIIFSRHGFQTLANKFHTGLNLNSWVRVALVPPPLGAIHLQLL